MKASAASGGKSARSKPDGDDETAAAADTTVRNGVWTRIVAIVGAVAYSIVAVLFFCSAIAIIVLALLELWNGINPTASPGVGPRFNSVLECIALLTIAVVALELGQTVLEEEVHRSANVSAPTRVRRFLSRFLIVVVVALSVETLVTVFRLSHDDPARLPQAATIGLAAAALLAAWGVFVRLNTSAEKLEPEAMARAKSEDKKVEQDVKT